MSSIRHLGDRSSLADGEDTTEWWRQNKRDGQTSELLEDGEIEKDKGNTGIYTRLYSLALYQRRGVEMKRERENISPLSIYLFLYVY